MMEFVSATHAYATYKPAAEMLSAAFGPKEHAIDARGWGRDDYAQELRLKAIDVAAVFQKRVGFCLTAERRYTYKAMWNRARNWQRSARRRGAMEVHLDGAVEQFAGVYQMDEQIEARQKARVIVEALSPDERELAVRLLENGGNVKAAWQPGRDGSLRIFRRRIDKLRCSARKAVWRSKNTVTDSRLRG